MKNFRIGVQQATTSVEFVEDRIKPIQSLRVYPGLSATYAALASGQVDAVVYDTAQSTKSGSLVRWNDDGGRPVLDGRELRSDFYQGSANEAAIQ